MNDAAAHQRESGMMHRVQVMTVMGRAIARAPREGLLWTVALVMSFGQMVSSSLAQTPNPIVVIQ